MISTGMWQLALTLLFLASQSLCFRILRRSPIFTSTSNACSKQQYQYLSYFDEVDGYGEDTFDAKEGTRFFETEGVYGELLPSSLREILLDVNTRPDDIVYDLGSGTGKVVAQFAYETNVKKVIGVELGRKRHESAQLVLDKLLKLGDGGSHKIQLICGDLLDVSWQDATILFINAFCFPPLVMLEIEKRIRLQCPKLRYILLFGQRLGLEYRLQLAEAGGWLPGAGGKDVNSIGSDDELLLSQELAFQHFSVPNVRMSFSDDCYCELYISIDELRKRRTFATDVYSLYHH